MKLTAISSRGRKVRTWGLLEEVLAGVLGALEQYRRQENKGEVVE